MVEEKHVDDLVEFRLFYLRLFFGVKKINWIVFLD